MALEMAEADASYYMPYQYGNQANPTRTTTAPPSRSSRSSTRSPPSSRLGTGGTLMGNARRLKEDPDTMIVAAEPLQVSSFRGCAH